MSSSSMSSNLLIKKHILLTGATGFVGQHLITKLQQNNYQITAAVRQKTDALSSCVEQIVIGDFADDPAWGAALEGIDTVIHLAALSQSSKNPTSVEKARLHTINVEASKKLASASIAAGVKRFIFLSSVKVLGEISATGFTEQSPYNPADEYARSKCQAEQDLKQLIEHNKMELVIIRPPMIYGKGSSGNFNKLVAMVKKGLPLPLGMVKNKRTLCSVYNLVDFIDKTIQSPAAANETFLVADNETISTASLVRLIGQHQNKSVTLLPIPIMLLKLVALLVRRPEIVSRLTDDLQVNTNKAQEKLNWQPPFTMDEALAKTLSS